MKKIILLLVACTAIGATLYRNGTIDVSGVDYGMTPLNTPNVGDVLSVTAAGAQWTNISIQEWSGTTGGTLLGIGASTFLPPNSTSGTLVLADAAGVTRTPVTRALILQNLYAIVTPAPGSGKTTTVTVLTNGVASPLTVSIVGTLTNANDTTHTVSVTAGTEVGVKIVTAASSVAGKCSWAFQGR